MHLLLTRPDGRIGPLADKLAALGVRTTRAPMVTLVDNPDAGPSPLDTVDGAFFVSPTAVECAHQRLQGKWPDIAYFAVGGGTAAALRRCGVEPICPPPGEETTEGVLALPDWQYLTGKRMAIVRGVGGREVMAATLRADGFDVQFWELYRRQRPEWPAQTVQSWRQNGVDVILATSGEILANLFAVTPLSDHDWLRNCLWLVPVERVAELAQQRGCQRIQVMGGAGDDAIVRCLGSMNHYGEDPEGSAGSPGPS
ncbi:uroporphyrinogen-III synthase [Ferrimonas balearica]|uniref:uroporphyrinogen-III synthase n=1 Tax=Ferrimonas balearica TaxID=44012 RepID=UPI001F293CE4|nr:uroporphyrinogen-III synthase [Ferrimonas balearica]MBY6019562.1 uroporphyrinogen-III synthase [Halomonas denitrificans]MBY6096628.1 uroporphyrinogen-III synthase [Ferrimonas balearica]